MSAPFKKLKLVPEEELLRLKDRQLRQYEPNIRSMAATDQQIDNLLDPTQDSNLNADSRLRLLDMLKSRFRQIKAASKIDTNTVTTAHPTIIHVAHKSNGPSRLQTLEEDSDIEEYQDAKEYSSPKPVDSTEHMKPDLTLAKNIISVIHTKFRKDAKDLLNDILQKPEYLSYNNNMEAVVNGKCIHGSNFINLFKTVFASSKNVKDRSLTGYKDFHRALSPFIPSHSLRSCSTKSSLHPPSSSSSLSPIPSSFTSPPGLKPIVKHVYNSDFD